jgi:hypothetical protein
VPKFEVDLSLLISTLVRVTVEAETKDAAMDAALDMFPGNYKPGSAKGWKADIKLTAPNGGEIKVVKTQNFELASGGEKVRKVK